MTETFTLALLDKDGVLTGYEACTKRKWKPAAGRVPVPEACDLVPGRYRWTGKTFAPLPPKGSEAALLEDGDAMSAIALGFLALGDGQPVPAGTRTWAARYVKSFDTQGRLKRGAAK